MSKNDFSKSFTEYLKQYIMSGKSTDEFEIRFGTNYSNKITRIDFDNVIKKLKMNNYTCETPSGQYHLNIQNEFLDERTGRLRTSNIRTEIKGLMNIKKYCTKNTFNLEIPEIYVSFLQKRGKETSGGSKLMPLNNADYEFRVNYKTENRLTSEYPMVRQMLNDWNNNKKTFRLIKRFTFKKEGLPFKFDLSVLRTSKWDYKSRKYIAESSVQKSNLFNNQESYEIEIELLNDEINKEMDPLALKKLLNRGIKLILSGLQQTNFPISYTEQKAVVYNYVKLTSNSTNEALFSNDNKGHSMRKNRKNFIGYSSITLEMENAAPCVPDLNIPNIHTPYTVTDKADGIRKLLYVGQKGKIYMIDINMNVQYTGLITKDNEYYNSVLDGEHIIHDKHGKYLNLYMCFDIYFKKKEDCRYYPLIYKNDMKFDDPKYDKNLSRLEILNKFVKGMEVTSIIKDKKPTMNIKVKTFYSNRSATNQKISLFKSCKELLDGMEDGSMFEYETDGLIFTPIDKSVGSSKLGVMEHQKTWKHSFKWKPPQYNTIDFLVITKKNDTGRDSINHLFQEGTNMTQNKNNLLQYKTIELRVGFNSKQHGFINPSQDVIDGNYPGSKNYDNRDYKPVPFFPTEPTPNFKVNICNIPLIGGNMFIEDKTETFEDKTIVEFKYVKENEKHWQWVPIRVRHDKTADYRSGNRNFGNAYHVANGVWKSIHNPITKEMLSGEGLFDLENSEVYYKKVNSETNTRSLRDFHNKYVKQLLIVNASDEAETLVDMSVGRGGDLWKWHQSKLNFVLGFDLSKMNLENRKDGACARYLTFKGKHGNAPTCLFINANSGLNLRNKSGILDSKGKMLMDAIVGKGSKDKDVLGKVAYNNFGIGKEGFDVVSNMFSTHYFFENIEMLNEYLRNVSENCKINGYFIGTCYDGTKVFNMLSDKSHGESEYIIENGKKVWEIKKMYSNESFPTDMTGVGLRVDVYQESINKMFPEYLVNFEYFKELLELYGFAPIDSNECKKFGVFTGVDSFQRLYTKMENDVENKEMHKKQVGQALDMTDNEKKVSFLNNYFIFKKVRNVDASNVFKIQMEKANDTIDKNKEKLQRMKDNIKVIKRNVVKLKRKIRLV